MSSFVNHLLEGRYTFLCKCVVIRRISPSASISSSVVKCMMASFPLSLFFTKSMMSSVFCSDFKSHVVYSSVYTDILPRNCIHLNKLVSFQSYADQEGTCSVHLGLAWPQDHFIEVTTPLCRGHKMWSHDFLCWGNNIFFSWPLV